MSTGPMPPSAWRTCGSTRAFPRACVVSSGPAAKLLATLADVLHASKWKRLREKGWKEGSAAAFLRLSPEEEASVELKLQLSDADKTLRRRRR